MAVDSGARIQWESLSSFCCEGVALDSPCFKVKIKIHTSLIIWYAVRGLTAAFEYKNQVSSSQVSHKAGNYNKGHKSTRKQHTCFSHAALKFNFCRVNSINLFEKFSFLKIHLLLHSPMLEHIAYSYRHCIQVVWKFSFMLSYNCVCFEHLIDRFISFYCVYWTLLFVNLGKMTYSVSFVYAYGYTGLCFCHFVKGRQLLWLSICFLRPCNLSEWGLLLKERICS